MRTVPRLLQCLVVCSLGLAGCSTHPLPKDRTGLDVNDIVHRVQCEAAQAIVDLARDNDLVRYRSALDALEVEEGPRATEVRQLSQKLTGEFGATLDEANEARYTTAIRIQRLTDQIDKLLEASGRSSSDDLTGEALIVEGHRLIDRLARVSQEYQTLGELAVASDALEAVRKKHKKTDLKQLLKYEGHVMVFSFKFLVTENNDATINGSVAWPIALGTFTLGFDVGDKKQRLADRRVTVVAVFGELIDLLREKKCVDIDGSETALLPRRYPITGNIGVEEVVREYLKIEESGKFSGADAYYDRIEFTTTMNASLRPEGSLNRKIGQTIVLKPELKANRQDVHEVKLSLSPPSDGKPAAAIGYVEIKKLPELKVRHVAPSLLD